MTARHPARAERAKLERMRDAGPGLAATMARVLTFLTDPEADGFYADRVEIEVRAALAAAGVIE